MCLTRQLKRLEETPSALSLEVESNKIEDAKDEDELSIEIKAVPEEEAVDSLTRELWKNTSV